MAEPSLTCRSCGAALTRPFVDLGLSPISNAMRRADQDGEPEAFYPLRTFVCDACRLVQIQDVAAREAHFHGDYTYFSSFSDSWLAHARTYAQAMITRLDLGPDSRVVEVASNDGYLLQYFKAAGVPVQGVDPAANCAEAARNQRGVPTLVRFFGVETAREMTAAGLSADLIVANNVLAHVPDLNDFVAGFRILLKPDGVATVEFPHLLRLIEANYFDTIYHEHYSYLSLLAVERLLRRHGLQVFDLEELQTHGGSLRLFFGHADRVAPTTWALVAFRAREAAAGLDGPDAYGAFAERVRRTKRDLLKLLIRLKDEGATIAAYGAPAKGSTLLNYCGVGADFLDYAVDRNPHKQGLYLPGVAIPVHPPERVFETRPDYLLVLPWNLKDEILGQMAGIRAWGGRFILPLPEPVVLP
jgi:2-polyprenyl-3-methyl-5-hydroxy-6-metoxy-1,4-benzoquinol methylase